MRIFFWAFMTLLPQLTLADPSQASFAASLGTTNVAGEVKVASADQPEERRNGITHWIAMESTLDVPRTFQIETMTFKVDETSITCEKTECVAGYFVGYRVNPGELLLVKSGKEITSITFNMSDGSRFKHLATIEGPFHDCVADRDTRRLYETGRGTSPVIAIIPITNELADSGQTGYFNYCVR